MRLHPFLLLIALFVFHGCNDSSNVIEDEKKASVFELIKYIEPDDPDPIPERAWEGVPTSLMGSIGSINQRYNRSTPPLVENSLKWDGVAWRGERVNIQLVVWSADDAGDLTLHNEVLKNNSGDEISEKFVRSRFVRYVLTDEFAGGCGYRKKEDFEVHLVADALDEVSTLQLPSQTTRPIWVTIDVPKDANPGVYKTQVMIESSNGGNLTFDLELEVQDQQLPEPGNWSYHLDLWQNPYAVARLHNVELWSDAHFARMKPLISMLANAGQKCITTSIIDKPWNGQTEDPFESMIEWRKKVDGTWSYDYTVFDKWVEFAHDMGITEQINCYTMVPWGMSFAYHDEASDSLAVMKAEPGTKEYTDHWTPFLKDFVGHLKSKGWFEKTTIAMDERPMKAMQEVIKLVKSVEPDFKITLAGGYHEEIEGDIYDLCVASRYTIPEDVMSRRKEAGMPTTYYTCCTEPYPNNFTFSPPSEGTWQAWHSAYKGYTGYLRWAYNSWVSDPFTDSRFRAWPAGDTYMVYPDARSSIRFETIRDGIEDFEKIRLIKSKLEEKGMTKELDELMEILNAFEISNLKDTPAEDAVSRGKNFLHKVSRLL